MRLSKNSNLAKILMHGQLSSPPFLKAMLPNELWGSCHVVTEGAALQSNAVEGDDYRKVVGKRDFKNN